MHHAEFEFTVGEEDTGGPSAWLAGRVSGDETGFNLLVDLCERNELGGLLVCRAEIEVHERFSAEVFLLLLSQACDQPFTPSQGGLSLYSRGGRHPFSNELIRIVDPKVRRDVAGQILEGEDAALFDLKLANAARHRKMQRLLLGPSKEEASDKRVEAGSSEPK